MSHHRVYITYTFMDTLCITFITAVKSFTAVLESTRQHNETVYLLYLHTLHTKLWWFPCSEMFKALTQVLLSKFCVYPFKPSGKWSEQSLQRCINIWIPSKSSFSLLFFVCFTTYNFFLIPCSLHSIINFHSGTIHIADVCFWMTKNEAPVEHND